WSWQWVEQLLANEEQQVEDLTELLVGFSLQTSNPDRWRWVPGAYGLFSVKSCYNVLLENHQVADLDPNVLVANRKRIFSSRGLCPSLLPLSVSKRVWDAVYTWI
ncbi:hypothetical protein A2U01_0042935, partial [Trifolium medium]|nr:hypothetical protein [Trifolium medium]